MNAPLLAIIDANTKAALLGVPLMFFLIAGIVILAIWDCVWKMIGMWKSARNGHMGWFICIAIFNTIGILPILYILVFQKNEPPAPVRA